MQAIYLVCGADGPQLKRNPLGGRRAMSTPDTNLRAQVDAELKRLGLRREDLPGAGLMAGSGGIEAFIAHLRKFQRGATWRDIVPDLPSHWEVGKPETWTVPYRPLGPFDYQELPTAPALHVLWRNGTPGDLEKLVAQARAAGWRIHGAGKIRGPHGKDSEHHALLVLERGTTEDQLHEFGAWINRQPDFAVATFIRLGTERYVDV